MKRLDQLISIISITGKRHPHLETLADEAHVDAPSMGDFIRGYAGRE